MEESANAGRYDWIATYIPDYIGAYYYFASSIRALVQPPGIVYFTWGPAGDYAAIPFYPGDDVVDFIGVECYSFEDYDLTVSGSPQSFQTVMNQCYSMAAQCNPNKPVMVWEMGAASTPRCSRFRGRN